MAASEPFDWRRSDRRLFAAAAIVFPIIVLIGFGRSYYLKFAFEGAPPLPGLLVHAHGALMTIWVGFTIWQIWLIRSKNARVHMNLGMIGIALAIAIVFIGFFTAVAGAKYAAAAPGGVPPLSFLAVPIFDLVTFAGLFTAAIYYRTRPASHKRLMLLMIISLLPPAIARFPFSFVEPAGPVLFFGLPALMAIVLVAWDTWRNRKLNVPFLVGTIAMIASYPLRLMIAGTDTWMSFAAWLTTWAA